jgi:hypothetical protein
MSNECQTLLRPRLGVPSKPFWIRLNDRPSALGSITGSICPSLGRLVRLCGSSVARPTQRRPSDATSLRLAACVRPGRALDLARLPDVPAEAAACAANLYE